MLTLPQIEIMSADLPHTLFKQKKDKPTVEDVEDATRMMREAYERKKKKKDEFTIDDVFSGEADIHTETE